MKEQRFNNILCKALEGDPLTRSEINNLLATREKGKIRRIFEVARSLRKKYFGTTVFLYGFVYFSNYCRNDCTFCINRHSNRLAQRYRKEADVILKACEYFAESGIHCIDLTMGEDPFFYQSEERFLLICEITEKVKQELYLPIMLSPGTLPQAFLPYLVEKGVDWFACYQETYNRALFQKIRPNQSFQNRLDLKYNAKELGLLVEEGILTGIGESLEDVADALAAMDKLGAHQRRVMRFIPQKETPLSGKCTSDRTTELIIIAVLRILFPDRLIPASLDIDGINGLMMRLDAGANVITSLIPPSMGLTGVAQPVLDINDGQRSVESVIPVLKAAGLVPASLKEYTRWITNEQERMRTCDPLGKEAVL